MNMSKQTILLLILIGSSVCGLPMHGQTTNLLANGGFEQGSDGWINTWAATGSHVTDRTHSGHGALRISNSERKNSLWLRMLTDVPLGPMYRVEAYARRDVDTINATMSLHTNSPPYYRTASVGPIQQIGEWKLLAVELSPRHNGELWIHLSGEGIGNVWFDDVTVTVTQSKAQRSAALNAITVDATAPAAARAQAHLELGEIVRWADRDSQAACVHFRNVCTLIPDDTTKCRMALDAVAESSRRSRNYAGATQALRQKIDHYSSADTVEGAMDLAMLAETLGEEAFHLQPDYAAATARLTEALGLYIRAMAIYASLDPIAHKPAIDKMADRIVVTRYDINAYGDAR